MPRGPFFPRQRVWDGHFLHEVVAALPNADWSQVFTRIVGRRKNNVVSLAEIKANNAGPDR